MSIKDFNVSFRYVGIPTGLGAVCGICLSYQKKEGAESFFHSIYKHLSSFGFVARTALDIEAIRESNNLFYSLLIKVGLGKIMRHIEIIGVEPSYINEIRNSLNTFKYYLILTGYIAEDGKFVLMPIATNHLLVNKIIIDGKQYFGNPGCTLSWNELVQSKYIISVE